ncbi:PhzF family phenazine biosynthesis protein [Virgisporangium aurantiacum]|uniref:PhzF family phenazine biosynthesis protein n=1 Tax=Virgisporangium aurantiacum TaxID=175570 RepID=UPI001951C004|nr:PhzF family phenazine biosynthesis protein [Virgisporangium aurantiacum]
MPRPITYVDVFTDSPYRGNPVAVVHDATGLSTGDMQRFARWTNLSETTFLLPPTEPGADYLLRIFTPAAELPFAGHPTLGSCHAWLASGGVPASADEVVQQCGAGLVKIHRGADRLAFAAPPLVRSGPIDAGLLADVVAALGVKPSAVVDSAWVDNGPGWLAVLLGSAEEVLAVRPSFIDQDIGVVGPHAAGSAEAFELRAFFPVNGALREDPVTGSLNASVAQWLLGSGRASAPYVASQGTALGWAGRAHISRDGDGTIWVGGGTVTCVAGEVQL